MAKFYNALRLVLNCPVISKELWCLLMLLGNNVITVMLVRYLEVFITIYSTTNNQLNSENGGIQKLRYFYMLSPFLAFFKVGPQTSDLCY